MPETIQALLLPIAFLAIFYLFIIRPQKKKEKEINEMRNSLSVGDKVVTIGGMVGKVVKIKEDMVTLEVGADKTKLQFKKWAIGTSDNSGSSKKESAVDDSRYRSYDQDSDSSCADESCTDSNCTDDDCTKE